MWFEFLFNCFLYLLMLSTDKCTNLLIELEMSKSDVTLEINSANLDPKIAAQVQVTGRSDEELSKLLSPYCMNVMCQV